MRDRLRYLLVETDGGSNRTDIVRELDEYPKNANEVAERLDLNYNTARYHLHVLRDHGIVESDGAAYGEEYALTEQFDRFYDEYRRIVGDGD